MADAGCREHDDRHESSFLRGRDARHSRYAHGEVAINSRTPLANPYYRLASVSVSALAITANPAFPARLAFPGHRGIACPFSGAIMETFLRLGIPTFRRGIPAHSCARARAFIFFLPSRRVTLMRISSNGWDDGTAARFMGLLLRDSCRENYRVHAVQARFAAGKFRITGKRTVRYVRKRKMKNMEKSPLPFPPSSFFFFFLPL